MFEKFKEEYQYLPKNDLIGFLKYQYLIKKSYLNAIDAIIEQQVGLCKKYIIGHGDVLLTIEYLQEQRKLIEKYE